MKERAKDRQAAALMGQLLIQLAQRDDIKRKLGEFDPANIDEFAKQLLDEFGEALEQKLVRMLVDERLKKSQQAKLTLVPRPDPETDEEPAPSSPSERRRPVEPESPPPPPRFPPDPPHPVTPPPVERPPLTSLPPLPGTRRQTGSSEENSSPSEKAIRLTETMRVPSFLLENPEVPDGAPPKEKKDDDSVRDRNGQLDTPGLYPFERADEQHPPSKPQLQRIRVELSDDDNLYLHGFCAIPPDQQPAATPFMLEEKGIEERDFACAIDLEGIRIYLTRLQGSSTNVSRKGILLLNKQDSMRWRGAHESILNDLRVHGNLVPFEFGTVALGLDDLRTKVQVHREDLTDALDEMQATTWWNLSVFALDSRMAQLVGSEGSTSRRGGEIERKSYTVQSQGVKLDIKTLERILGKQKKIAESIHDELTLIADRSDIDQMIGLGSGTTDDWKLILKASYEVPQSRVQRFHSAISESQYRHLMFEIMLSISGNVDRFSFLDAGA